jgi:hypothetical protein
LVELQLPVKGGKKRRVGPEGSRGLRGVCKETATIRAGSRRNADCSAVLDWPGVLTITCPEGILHE